VRAVCPRHEQDRPWARPAGAEQGGVWLGRTSPQDTSVSCQMLQEL
jgi:hypothetical protein